MQLSTPYPLSAVETEPLAFYAQPGPLTDPGPHAVLFDRLPTDVPALVEIVHNVLLHVFWIERHGLHLPEARQAEVSLRAVADMLSRLQAISPGPLTAPRAPEERLIGNCRHFATLLSALLRDQGLPARARCGFATYLNPGTYEDHWLCEYWDAATAALGRGRRSARRPQTPDAQARLRPAGRPGRSLPARRTRLGTGPPGRGRS